MPPERGHVQNVPLLQGTVQGVGLPKQREPLSMGQKKNNIKLFSTLKQVVRFLNICTIAMVFNHKQEAHGPHRSPEKTVQINKHI